MDEWLYQRIFEGGGENESSIANRLSLCMWEWVSAHVRREGKLEDI